MRWRGREQSQNVEDRRRVRPGGLAIGGGLGTIVLVVLFFLIMLAMDLVDRHRLALRPLYAWPMWLQGALAGCAVVGLLVWSGAVPQPFIYFQF